MDTIQNIYQKLEHNLYHSVFNWVTFCDKRKYKRSNMALMIRNGQKKNKLHRHFPHLHPLVWIFKRFWGPKWFWQDFCPKKSIHLDHSYLKYALDNVYLDKNFKFASHDTWIMNEPNVLRTKGGFLLHVCAHYKKIFMKEKMSLS